MQQTEGGVFPLTGSDATLSGGLLFIIVFLVFVGFAYFLLRYLRPTNTTKSARYLAWGFLFLGAAGEYIAWIIGDYFIIDPALREMSLNYGFAAFAVGAFLFVGITERIEKSRRQPYTIVVGLLVSYILITLIMQVYDRLAAFIIGIPLVLAFLIHYFRSLAKILNYNRSMFRPIFVFTFSIIMILAGMVLVSDYWLYTLGITARVVGELCIITGLNIFLATFERIPRPEEFDWMTKIRGILVIYHNGIPLFSRFWREGRIVEGPDLVSGALYAVKTVLQEMVGQERMNTVTFEDRTLLFEYREHFSAVIFADEALKSLRVRLKQFADEFGILFGPALEDWRGNNDVFVPAETIADSIFLPREVQNHK